MIAMLFLARWCQAALYNPGGFRKEFHQIRLSQTAGAILLLALIISYAIDDLLVVGCLFLTLLSCHRSAQPGSFSDGSETIVDSLVSSFLSDSVVVRSDILSAPYFSGFAR